ncbi:MAG TPA: hypothetical protein VLH10_22290 [Yinghuangia sp.]|nr:hypothetical protein [Yinghuangia sp.]
MSSIVLDLHSIAEAPPPIDEDDAATGPTDADAPDTAAGESPLAVPLPQPPARLRCATCGTVLTVDAPAPAPQTDAADAVPLDADDGDASWRVPVHAVLPTAVDPFAALPCPGSGLAADPATDAVDAPAPVPPSPPPTVLPLGLHWRDQPFSHASA